MSNEAVFYWDLTERERAALTREDVGLMWQSYDNSLERRWQAVVRDEFQLTPLELGTLVAIVCFHNCNDGAAVHLEQLRAFDHAYEGDDPIDTLSAPSVLYRKGLVMRIGPPQDRSFAPTLRGIRRVAA